MCNIWRFWTIKWLQFRLQRLLLPLLGIPVNCGGLYTQTGIPQPHSLLVYLEKWDIKSLPGLDCPHWTPLSQLTGRMTLVYIVTVVRVGKSHRLMVLRLYPFKNVVIRRIICFCQSKNHKSTEILHTGPLKYYKGQTWVGTIRTPLKCEFVRDQSCTYARKLHIFDS